jgi:uncharacterized protein YndB with AHSA1/START domain
VTSTNHTQHNPGVTLDGGTELGSLERGSIEREIYVDATPDVVFDVVSRPEHIAQWWSDEADFEPAPGAVGELVFGDRTHVPTIHVVTVQRPHLFAFRWCYPDEKVTDDAASLLVTFELVPCGSGTTIRFSEVGFREMGWEIAQLEAAYREHATGWSLFLPRLGPYAVEVASRT